MNRLSRRSIVAGAILFCWVTLAGVEEDVVRIGYAFNENIGGTTYDFYGTMDARYSGFWSLNPPYDEQYGRAWIPGGFSGGDGDYSTVHLQGNRVVLEELPTLLGESWPSFTLELHVILPEDDSTWNRALSIGEASALRRVRDETRIGSGITAPRIESSDLEEGQWYHVALIHDAEAETVAMYIDGGHVATEPIDPDVMPESPELMTIGATPQGGGSWGGQIDDFRLTTAVLSPEEFLREGFGPYIVKPPEAPEDLVRVGYSFNEGSTTFAAGDAIDYYGALDGRFSGTWSPNPPYDEEYDNFFLPGFSSEEGDYGIFCPQGNRVNSDIPEVLGDEWSSFTVEMHLMMPPDDGRTWLRALAIGDESAFMRLRDERRLRNSLTNPAIETPGRLVPEPGEWQHIAMTYNAEREIISMYVNGERYNTQPVNTESMPPNSAPFDIGARPTGGGGWTGRIDDFRFTNTILAPGDFLREGYGTELTQPSGISFTAWQEDHFSSADLDDEDVSGPLANPTGDGIANIIKYAFGLDPREPARGELPRSEVIEGELHLTFPWRNNADDLSFTVQLSEDLVEWVSGPDEVETVSVEQLQEGFEHVTVRSLRQHDSRAFIRVLVELD